ncbi:alpha/beta fold hydrolase [Leucobacter chromiiresistens]|uniref:Esterase n=1 Tax=Leucobacter chromiiresistens TaxID=1079994 RepID=A0A147ESF9_9MICO|nr:alpha/beta hydrolase [Leucobacter chromiiresistens]KTR87357.1 esterase [Leucobacter chromiiresistens]
MTTHLSTPPILLIAGHWLGSWAWDAVLQQLSATGLRANALTLPGFDPHDPERRRATLADQAGAIRAHLASHAGAPPRRAVIVAHSGANAPVTLFADRHPELVERIVWVDSGPIASGSVFAPDLPEGVAEVALPPFDELAQQASLDGLSAADLARFRDRAVPVPGPVLRGRVDLPNAARHGIPTTLVCCSIPGAQVLELARSGHPMFAEVAMLADLEVVDLPTGHWPMWSRPSDLAAVLRAAASRVARE